MLVAGSEKPAVLRALGRSSNAPERWGCDYLARIPSSASGGSGGGGRFLGVQRKEISDLLASLTDGRLNMERAQWNQLLGVGGIVVLVIEGRLTWTTDGVLMKEYGKPFTRRQLRRLIHSVNRQGVSVQFSDSPKDTAELIEDLVRYHTERRTGSRMVGRPGPVGKWGKASSREWLVHLLTSFPGVGPTTAEAILDANGGTIPLQWTVTKEWLNAIPGIGPKRADALWKALEPTLTVVPNPTSTRRRKKA